MRTTALEKHTQTARTTPLEANSRERCAQTVDLLRKPASYLTPVSSVTAIETHMSWVFLTETLAYKLKKPISAPNLDYTTLAARQCACQAELSLNRRLAPSVYLDVVPFAQTPLGPRVEGTGQVIEWLVKMRRLPAERMLDACIARGTVQPTQIDRLVDVLTAFYARTQPAAQKPARYLERIQSELDHKRASLELPRYGLERTEITALADKQTAWLSQYRALLEERAAHVVDAHGDLRPEHVCLEAEPLVIDCLEFDRSLRELDPLSELAFLALECRRLSAHWIGARVLQRYMQCSGQHTPPQLLAFYQSYHALIRAAIAIWHLDDATDQHPRFYARARTYLQLGAQLL